MANFFRDLIEEVKDEDTSIAADGQGAGEFSGRPQRDDLRHATCPVPGTGRRPFSGRTRRGRLALRGPGDRRVHRRCLFRSSSSGRLAWLR